MCGDSWSHLAIRRESYHLPIVCTRECSVTIVTSRLKHRTAVDTGVIANGAHRSDHCNVITSSFRVNGEGHSKPKVIHSKSSDQTRNTWIENSSIVSSRLVYAPNLLPYERLHLFNYGGWQCSIYFHVQVGSDIDSARAMRHEFEWKYREFASFVL